MKRRDERKGMKSRDEERGDRARSSLDLLPFLVDMASLGFSHDTNLRFLLHKKSGMVIPTTDRRGVDQVTQSDTILAEIGPHWDRARRMIVGKDISRMLVEIVQSLGPVDMGTKGGCYFVLADQENALNRLARLIAVLPTTSTYKPFMTMLGIPDEAQTRRELTKATKVRLDGDLKALRLDLERREREEIKG
jgi:hypothetical protein